MDTNKAPQGTFTKIPNVLLDTCDLSDEAIMLFGRLLRQVGHKGGVFHGSIRKLASAVQVKRDKAHRNLNVLKAAKLVSTGTDSDLDISIIELHTDDLWELNIAYNDGIEVPRWTDLQEVLKLVREIRQQREDELSQKSDNLSEKSDAHDANIGQSVRETGQSVRPSEHKVPPKNEKNINTNKTTEEGLHFHATLTPDQQRIHYFYCQIVSSEPKVTEDLRKHWTALARRIKTQEDMNSLYEHSKKCILADDSKKIKKVYPGNLASDVDAWVNEREAQVFELPGPTETPADPTPAIYREHVPLPVDMQEWMIETALEFGSDEIACVNELEWCFQHTSCTEEEFYSKLIRAYGIAERSRCIDTLFAELKQSLSLIVEAIRVS